MSGLSGRRVVVTRAPHQASEFEQLLRERGAVPLLYPCIDIAPPHDTAPLDSALRDAARGAFDGLVLTSSNTVQAVASRLQTLNLTLPALNAAAVGTATAESARRLLGLRVSVIPDTYTAEALAAVLTPIAGKNLLLPQSALADDILASNLRATGANVTVVEAYQIVIGSGGVDLPALLAASTIDVITFTSPSTVRNLLSRLQAEGGDRTLLDCIACIGTKTAAAARDCGLTVVVVPPEHTLSGLTAALEHHFDLIRSH